MQQTGNLHSYLSDGTFYDIDTVHDLAQAADILPPLLRRPAVFLDRDGVINRDFGWVGTPDRFEWEPGVLETIAGLTQDGYHLFIVTNQSGIARGFYSEADLQALMTWVVDMIRSHGGTIDDWRYCPMHPEAPLPQYRAISENRKPAPGMILDLIQAWSLDPDRCVLFGDQPSDMQAAAAAGIQSVPVGPSSLFQLVAEGHHLKI
ncbi:HAD family hydrolase [Gluconobacter kanchanaburiensis]|nr:HAD family hydrolase [Gluconobacter kanchanaburiensis]